jgi:hypothetical protein
VFYPNDGSTAYYEVECGGKIDERGMDSGKFVCTEIKLIKEIAAPENKFNWCGDFKDGYAIVGVNGKYNYINTKGKYVSDEWFDDCYSFQDGYAKVCLNDKYNYINDGSARVCLNGKYNYINTDGKYLFEQWWDYCSNPKDGYVRVDLKGKWYIKQIK